MSKIPLTFAAVSARDAQTASGWAQRSAGKLTVTARLRRLMLRVLCRRTRSLRRSLRQFTREIYICP